MTRRLVIRSVVEAFVKCLIDPFRARRREYRYKRFLDSCDKAQPSIRRVKRTV